MWWDSMSIAERISLREKYRFNSPQSMDVDDYRSIYEQEHKHTSKERITEIDELIAKLQAEKEKLEVESKVSDIDAKINDYLDSYYGRQLVEAHTLDEYGLWEVKGEDPNCDFGGVHIQPKLGIVQGTLKQALVYALNHPNFYTWGSGGKIEKVNIITMD